MRRLSARPTLLISCGWLALVLLAMLFPELFSNTVGAFASLGIVIAGKFAIYWVLAETMGGLAREGKGASPAWYLNPLSTHAALLGTLLTALLAILLPLAGLVAFLPLHSAAWMEAFLMYTPTGLSQFGCSAISVAETTVQFITRLAHFALFSACIQLALRHMAYAPRLPVMLAAAATLLGFWQVEGFEQLRGLTGSSTPSWTWNAGNLILSLLYLAVLLYVCKWCAKRKFPSSLHSLPLLSAVVLPVLLSLAAIWWIIDGSINFYGRSLGSVVDWVYSSALLSTHAFYSLFAPDASPIVNYNNWEVTAWLYSSPPRLQFYSLALPGLQCWVIYAVVIALSFCMLWIACMHCLEVARNPAKRLARAKRRNRE